MINNFIKYFVFVFMLANCTSKVSMFDKPESSSAQDKPAAQAAPPPPPPSGTISVPDTQNPANCKFAGTVIPDGSSRTVYSADKVGCSGSCTSGTVQCFNGSLTGNVTYTNLSCSKICSCITPWGQTVTQGQSVTAYKASTSTCGDTSNTCDNPNNKITVRCDDALNGVLTITSGSGPLSNYTSPVCIPPTCGCVYQGIVFTPNTSPLPVYKMDKKTPPAKCADSTNKGSVTCTLKDGDYVLGGSNDQVTYPYTSCKDDVTGGSSGGGAGGGGGTGGGIGNDVGDGEGFKRTGISGGTGCSPFSPPYYCAGFSLAYQFASSMCFLPTEEGYPAAPSGLGQRVTPGSYVPAFNVKTVHCPDRCSNHMTLIHCDNGVMSDKTRYPYLDCTEICP